MNAIAHEHPFRHWLATGLAPARWLDQVRREVPPPSWPGWVLYQNELEQKRTTRDVAQLGPTTRKLFSYLSGSVSFRNDLRYMSGIPDLQADPALYGGGLHVVDPGGWLQCHLDHQIGADPTMERRLNLVLFLSAEWLPAWGGALELCDPMGRPVKRVFPSPGAAVLWESSDLAYHAVQQVTEDAPSRITAACYYLSPARPTATRRRALFVPRR